MTLPQAAFLDRVPISAGPSVTSMTGLRSLPPPRVHPFVTAKVASRDPDFAKNYLSAHTRVSLRALLAIGGLVALTILLLALFG